MSSKGARIEDSESDGESNFLEEWIDGQRVDVAFNAVQMNDELVCVDAGCNRLVLIESSDMEYYLPAAAGSSLRTAQSGNHLVI